MRRSSAAEPARENLAGLVERVTFHNEDNGFCVLRVKARGQRDLITVVGHAAVIGAGEFVQTSGRWVNDRTHGVQFRADFLRAAPPTTAEGIEKYLASGMIKGVGDVFRQACRDLGAIAGNAVPDPIQLADRVFQAVTTNDYGEYDQLIHVIFSALREPGLARLKSRLSSALAERPKTNDHYNSETAALQRALQDIADGEGDVDAYMAHESAASRKSPKVAAEIATRLLATGRAEEAHAVLEGGSPEPGRPWSIDWELAWVEALLATDRRDEAQSFRWSCFQHRLDAGHLRAYLKALPDFEDVLVEEKALDYALTFPDFATALAFFIDWKELRYAARLVLERSAESDGNAYFLLDPAAKALEGKQPLAATLLRRAMIEDTLNGAKYKRYRHAARHMLECQALDPSIEDYATFETHDAFINRIRAKHGRKTSFWSHVAELTASPAARPQI